MPPKLPASSDVPMAEWRPAKPMSLDPVHYRKVIEDAANHRHGMEIGGAGVTRHFWRTLGWGVILVIVGALFTFLFYNFTNNLRIALVVVMGMLVYMLGMAYLAEGRIESRNRD